MIVIASGTRSSGTSLLYRILATGGGKTPLHLPAYPPEFREQDWSTDFPTALFVVIRRNWFFAAQSALARGFHATMADALAEQHEARRYLGVQIAQLGDRVHAVLYEALIHDPERVIGGIDQWLRFNGYRGEPLSLPEPIIDGDAKYREAA